MRRIITSFLFCLITMTTYAQTEHVKFMGIPINGTITQFQQKLQAKGIKYNREYSSVSGPGTRFFDGVFLENKALFMVKYNSKTKIVYEVVVLFKEQPLDVAKIYFDDYNNKYSNKYFYWKEEASSWGGEKPKFYIVPSSNNLDVIGCIVIAIDYNPYNINFQYDLRIQYIDYHNSSLNDKEVDNEI